MLLNVQALRALAASLVVLVHLEILISAAGWPLRPALFGHSGVDLFFVLSGFLMVHTTTVRPISAGAFLINRLIRVAPLYWLCTLAVCVVATFRPSLLATTQLSVPALFKSLLFIPFAKANGWVEPLLFLGWTLNYEMFFYGVFALSLLLTPRTRTPAAMIVIIGLVVTGWATAPTSVFVRFYTQPIMLEFAIGMALSVILGPNRALPRTLAWAAVAGGLAVLIGRFSVLPLAERAWWSGLPAAVVLAGVVSLERDGVVSRSPVIQTIGAASYSLYLIHPFITRAMTTVAMAHAGARPLALSAVIVATFIAAVAAAIIVHWFVERPVTTKLRELARHRPSAVDVAERSVEETNAADDPPGLVAKPGGPCP